MIRKHDILDLCRSKAERGLMKWLTMTNGPHPLQQMIARLLNALASFHKGRRYLASSPFLLRLIVTQLISSQHFWDTITCNMLLGTLQKLSTESVYQLIMCNTPLLQSVSTKNHLHFYTVFIMSCNRLKEHRTFFFFIDFPPKKRF